MAEIRDKDRFDQMMALAEFGAKRNEEGRQLVFKMFVSYMTFLVVVAGLIMKHWKDDALKYGSAGLVALLVLLMIVYWEWIVKVYTGLIFNVRRRDFFMKKAEVICYHSSKELAGEYDPIEVSVNLGSGNRYEILETYLFDKRSPDIKDHHPRDPIPLTKLPKIRKPKIWNDRYFLFNLLFPLFLTALNIVALIFLGIRKNVVPMTIFCFFILASWIIIRTTPLLARTKRNGSG